MQTATNQFIGCATRATLAKFAGYSAAADSAGFAKEIHQAVTEAPILRTFLVPDESFEVECSAWERLLPKQGSVCVETPERHAFLAILAHLGWPLLLGAASCSVFYVLVYRGPLNQPSMHRYFASHPVLIIETGLFFVGLAALGLKAFDVLAQYWALNVVRLEEIPAAGQKIDDVGRLIQQVDQLSSSARQSYLGRRVRDILQAIHRKGSADGLDDELKYLADMDSARQQDSYGLVRIVIWATPMLGFWERSSASRKRWAIWTRSSWRRTSRRRWRGCWAGYTSLSIPRPLALSLSMILMFIQFLLDRIENQALSLADTRANEMLVGRFQEVGAGRDPYLASVERMSGRMLQAAEDLVRHQAEIWERTIQASNERWCQIGLVGRRRSPGGGARGPGEIPAEPHRRTGQGGTRRRGTSRPPLGTTADRVVRKRADHARPAGRDGQAGGDDGPGRQGHGRGRGTGKGVERQPPSTVRCRRISRTR